MMVNRVIQGQCQYGPPSKEKMFYKRLRMELREYWKKGNLEQLLNVAVYAYLESIAPQNPRFHWDPFVDSVTRGKV